MPLHFERTDFRGTPCVRLRSDGGGSALVALHGAHLLSWIPVDGRERLFLSERARFGPGAAIRGGVPVIFPQFAARGPLQKHGFARTLPWRFAGAEEQALFELSASEATVAWPHDFIAQLRIALDANSLTIALTIENPSQQTFAFTAALHTYLAVQDASAASVSGLDGCRYEDSADGGGVRQQQGDVRFHSEVDRIYVAPQAPLKLHDGARSLGISQEGFADTVVWNPGAALSAGIGDLEPGDFQRFVCVEAGQVLQPVVLAPGARWTGLQRLE